MALFLGGLPTTTEVKALLEAFPPKAGLKLTYEQVEQKIQAVHGTNRFRTVTDAWRKRVFRDFHLQSTAAGGTFEFLTADDAHDLGKRNFRRIGRAAGRLYTQVEVVNANALSEDRKVGHNLLRRETHAVLDVMRKSQKTIANPSPVTTSRPLMKRDDEARGKTS